MYYLFNRVRVISVLNDQKDIQIKLHQADKSESLCDLYCCCKCQAVAQRYIEGMNHGLGKEHTTGIVNTREGSLLILQSVFERILVKI